MLDLVGKALAVQSNPSGGAAQSTWMFPMLNKFVVSDANANLGQFIQAIVNWVLVIAGVVAVVYLIYGGLLYITAGGDAEKATKGRTAVVNAIIGVVIILLSFIIVTWVGNIVNKGNS